MITSSFPIAQAARLSHGQDVALWRFVVTFDLMDDQGQVVGQDAVLAATFETAPDDDALDWAYRRALQVAARMRSARYAVRDTELVAPKTLSAFESSQVALLRSGHGQDRIFLLGSFCAIDQAMPKAWAPHALARAVHPFV